MNWLDKVISSVSPEAGLRRAVARTRLEMMGSARSYDAAKTGHRTGGWRGVSGKSANAEVSLSLASVRDRSRDLVRNNPYAAKGVNVLVNGIVGSGIVPEPKSGTDRQQTATEEVWNAWAEQCDADGALDFYGLQALIIRCVVESGECLIRFRPRRLSDGLAVPLQLQVLEPDFIDTSRQETYADGSYTVEGIKFDRLGRRVGYWLYDRHPGDNRALMVAGITSRLIDASDILHIYDKLRPGQDRGMPWFAPIVLKLHDLADYDDAEAMRKKIESCMVAFVEQEAGGDTRSLGKVANDTPTDGTSGTIRRETFEPGMIEYLRPGESVETASPHAAGGYGEYMSVQLHAIAAGLGVTYEQLTGDLSLVNYSSYRAGHLEFRALCERVRWQLMVNQFCAPVWRRFLQVAFAAGAIRRPDVVADWVSPPWQSIDPEKEATASLIEMRIGGMTLRDYLTSKGKDFPEWLAETIETQAALDAAGIVLDSDARKRSRNGQAISTTGGTADAGNSGSNGNP
jgi:lambda family phage portal protein